MGPESRSPIVKPSFLKVCCVGVLLLVAFAARGSQGAAFLEEELPLTVTATTPSTLYSNDTGAIKFSGVQTITVVFSRALIAIGSDFGVEELPDDLLPFSFADDTVVVGRFRWVASNIARWDPVRPWSTDVNTSLVWNTKLATYDGVPLSLDIPSKRKIETESMQATVLGVGSLGALDRTDGHWDSDIGLEDENLPEVPPDGSIVIRFSYPVELPAIQSAVTVVIFEDEKGTNRKETDIKAIVKQCITTDTDLYDDDGPVTANCAIIELEGSRLEVGTRYAMIIPEGTKYSSEAGLLREEIVADFFGLREFRIPFHWDFRVKKYQNKIREQDFNGFVNGQNLTLWLPHGLAEGTTAADLKSAISLEWFPWKFMFQKKFPMDFELTLLNKGVASIIADFKPAEQYKLYVNARDDIRDGYGLPLKTSEVKFPVSKWAPFLCRMHQSRYLYFESSQVQSWDKLFPIVTRRAEKADIKVFSISVNSKEEAMKTGYQILGGYHQDLHDYLKKIEPDSQVTTPHYKELQSTDIDMSSTLQKSAMMGVVIGDDVYDPTKIMVLDYHIFMSTTLTNDKEHKASLWLVDLVTGKPAEGVVVHGMQWPEDRDSEKLVYRGVGTTDSMGVVSFPGVGCKEYSCESFAYWIQQKNSGSLLVGPQHIFRYSYRDDITNTASSASLTLDRAVVLPADKIRIIGRLVTRDGVDVKPFGQLGEVDKGKLVLEITPPLKPGVDYYTDKFPVEIDEYGAFEYVIEIQEDTVRQDYRVSMGSTGEGYIYDRFDFVATRTFAVGEPRIPTAVMEFITPSWVEPDSKFTIEVLVTSLLGTTLADAELSLDYTIRLESNDEIQATEILVTNSTGGASFEIDVTDAGVVIGDTIDLKITYIGPTRERIVEEANLRFQRSDKTVHVERLFGSDMPGLEFGIAATVTQMDVGNLEGLPVEIGLYRLPDSLELDNLMVRRQLTDPSDNTITVTKVSGCVVQSGKYASSLRDCRLSLPGVGKYMVRGCLDDSADGNGIVCGRFTLGKPEAAWEDTYSEDVLKAQLLLSREILPFGEPLDFFVDIPLDKFSLMVYWGNEINVTQKVFSFEDKGLKTISLDIGDNCIGKCSVSAQLGAARQETMAGMDLAKKIEFDPLGPRRFQMSGTSYQVIAYENEDLPFAMNVTVAVDGILPDEDFQPAVKAPGETANISVAVTRCPGKPTEPKNYACESPEPATNARVLIVAVDKAYLELSNVPLIKFDEVLRTTFVGRNSYELGYWPDNDRSFQFHSPSMFGRAWEKVQELFKANAWIGEDLQSYDRLLEKKINRPLQEILEGRSTSMTIGPPGIPGLMSYLGRETQQGSGREDTGPSGRSPSQSDPSLRSEDNFKAVPLFTVVKTDDQGNAVADFIAPENVGSFVVRAYATSLDAQHGSGESELIVRLPLSLTSSSPRLVRIGDDFEAGTIITLNGDQKEDVPVTVTLLANPEQANNIKLISTDNGAEPRVTGQDACPPGDLSCLVTLEEKKITSDADGQVEARFRFSAERIGDADITIRADAPGANDALQMSFPVLGQQEAVTVASSFAIEASEDGGPWDEGLVLPEAVPGSGTINLISGVGSYPAVLAAAESILAEKPPHPIAHLALANITLPHIFRIYGLGPGEDIHDRAMAGYNEAMSGLRKGHLTSDKLGLLYMPLKEMWSEPQAVSLSLNARGVWVVDQVSGVSEGISGNKDTWRAKLEDRFVEQAEELRKHNSTTSLYTIADVRFALGPKWTPERCPSEGVCTDGKTLKTMSMERISEAIADGKVLDFSVGTRAKIALTWLKHHGMEKGKNHQDVISILNSFRSSFRTIGRTAYISFRPDIASAADLSSQALVLLTFVRAGETGPLLQKLANYVSNQGSGSAAYFYTSSTTKIYTVLALAEYDRSKGSTDPDLALKVTSDSMALLEGEFRSPFDPVLNSSTLYDDLDDKSAPLTFTAQGMGEVSVAVTLDFIPAKLLPFPTYKGIFVEYCIQKAGAPGEGTGPCLNTTPLGWQLALTIQITSPDDLDTVIVRALMPGGIEPVDPLIADDSSARTTCQLETLSISYDFWYWPLCPQQETRPSAVTFTYDRLRAGTSTITFQAIAASVGTWVLPPVRAYAEQQPEVMGMSPAGEFVICENCEAKALEPAGAPKPCPNDCSGSGICDLNQGVCDCNVGFTKDDCSEVVTS